MERAKAYDQKAKRNFRRLRANVGYVLGFDSLGGLLGTAQGMRRDPRCRRMSAIPVSVQFGALARSDLFGSGGTPLTARRFSYQA